jgi:hypothetical protein
MYLYKETRTTQVIIRIWPYNLFYFVQVYKSLKILSFDFMLNFVIKGVNIHRTVPAPYLLDLLFKSMNPITATAVNPGYRPV